LLEADLLWTSSDSQDKSLFYIKKKKIHKASDSLIIILNMKDMVGV